MVPASFPESTRALSKPDDMSADECEPLCVVDLVYPNGYRGILSCWKLTKEELEEVNRTGRIWLTVIGAVMPPVILDGTHPIPPELRQS